MTSCVLIFHEATWNSYCQDVNAHGRCSIIEWLHLRIINFPIHLWKDQHVQLNYWSLENLSVMCGIINVHSDQFRWETSASHLLRLEPDKWVSCGFCYHNNIRISKNMKLYTSDTKFLCNSNTDLFVHGVD